MKHPQRYRLEYKTRIEKAVTYIRENLNRPICIKEIAQVACFSPYHFHRIFTLIMGEPPGAYITRKRLEYAAIRLVYSPDSAVSDVAFEFGYSSVSSFSKAFKQWFGCRPTEISKIKHCLNAADGKLQTKFETYIDADRLYRKAGANPRSKNFMELDRRVRIQKTAPFELYYLTSPQGYEFTSIRRTWKELLERVEDLNVEPSECRRFSLSHDHPALAPASCCRYDACISLPHNKAVQISLPKVVIPAGRYAIFPVDGPEDAILDQYLEFYTVWLPQSGYEADQFPVLEHYLVSCREGNLAVELWAKIRRQAFF